jgi:hypothetical protein
MKRVIFGFMIVGLLFCSMVSAFESFVVETDGDSARESLDRVSGQIDIGFAGSDQSYESENHVPKRGPFAAEY